MRMVECRRAWSRTINIVQMEDIECYGFQFRSIPRFAPTGKAGMMSWALCSILSSVKELWQAVDTKPNPFSVDGWEAWLLTYIQTNVFSFDSIRLDKRSPFKKISTKSEIIDKVNRFAPVPSNVGADLLEPETTFKFSIEFMHNLFNPTEHPSISVNPSVTDALTCEDSYYDDKAIVIVVGSGLPDEVGNDDSNHPDRLVFENGASFQLRSVVLLRVDDQFYGYRENTPHKFEAIRYLRHGGHYKCWWKQERSDDIVTQCTSNIVDSIRCDENVHQESHFLQHIMVYVKEQSPNIEQWKLQIF